MTKKIMNKLMLGMLDDIKKMRDAGQSEYAHDDNEVFANFNRTSDLLAVDRKKVLMTFALKHIDGIAAYIKGHKSQREKVTGRITDTIVYLMLLWGMIEEEEHDTISRTKSDAPLHNVPEGLSDKDIDLSLEGGSVSSYRIQSNGDLQEVRTKGVGIKKPETLGTT